MLSQQNEETSVLQKVVYTCIDFRVPYRTGTVIRSSRLISRYVSLPYIKSLFKFIIEKGHLKYKQ